MPVSYEGWKVAGESAASPSILSKAFDILGAFDERDRVMTLTEISQKIGMPKSTVHRLISRLIEIEVIEPHDAGYRVGVRLLHTVSTMPANSMREIALPHLSRLQAVVKRAVHLAVLRGPSVVILQALVTSDQAIEHPAGVSGAKLPTHLTALGRVMLAHLEVDQQNEILNRPLRAMTPKSKTNPGVIRAEFPTIRRNKYAVSKDEVAMGLGTVAMPILIKGRPMGAVSIQFDALGDPGERELNALRVVVQRITQETYNMLAKENPKLYPYGF